MGPNWCEEEKEIETEGTFSTQGDRPTPAFDDQGGRYKKSNEHVEKERYKYASCKRRVFGSLASPGPAMPGSRDALDDGAAARIGR